VDALRYIGGYGRMSWVGVTDWRDAAADPIAPFQKRIIDHMNDDHADTMVLYCEQFTRATGLSAVVMTGVDRYGFEMSAQTKDGPRPIRLPFSNRVSTAKEVRTELVALAQKARGE
jgi:putative heme iron utilization protein